MLRQTTVLSLMLCAMLCTGCGTVFSRAGRNSFGAYPYEAIYKYDAELFFHSRYDPPQPTSTFVLWSPVYVLSTVADGALDTLLLPVDLAFWAFGVHKDGLHM